jgi:ubiquinone/menaquinone biosynthesis C-methylase UbiE
MTETTAAYRGRTKYDKTAAEKYQRRKEGKNRAEMRLVDRAFAIIPKSARVLDVPCGGGRVAIHLAKRGYPMSAGDLSEAMLDIARDGFARAGLACDVQRQDIEKLTYPDQAFDAVICFRLFHHFPSADIRQRTVTELCRVAKQWVALSYFSPASVTSLKRKLRAAMGGRRSEHYATSLAEVSGFFKRSGFQLVKDFAQMPLVHTMHLALFARG